MKERGIIFSALMVRAILEGRKTQTRRIVRDLPGDRGGPVGDHVRWFERGTEDATRWCGRDGLGSLGWVRCPYGDPGDRLWVRETWQAWKRVSVEYDEWEPITREALTNGGWAEWLEHHGRPDAIEYKATSDRTGPWTSSIFMPRMASRITLEVTDVRVERLQSITEDDARAEGLPLPEPVPVELVRDGVRETAMAAIFDPRLAFATLWKSIHGADSWAANPWVWIVDFKVVRP